MILFCEDCGGKNDLNPKDLAGGRAVFKCSECGYPNSYPVDLKPFSDESGTNTDLFDAVKDIPDVVGAFVFDRQKGVTGSRMPDMLTPEDIHALGQGLADGYDSGEQNMPDMRTMTLVISDKHFFVAKREDGRYIVLVATTPDLSEPFTAFLNNAGKNASK